MIHVNTRALALQAALDNVIGRMNEDFLGLRSSQEGGQGDSRDPACRARAHSNGHARTARPVLLDTRSDSDSLSPEFGRDDSMLHAPVLYGGGTSHPSNGHPSGRGHSSQDSSPMSTGRSRQDSEDENTERAPPPC